MAVDDFAAVYSRNRRGYGNRGCRPFHTSMGKKIISPSRSNLAKKKSKSWKTRVDIYLITRSRSFGCSDFCCHSTSWAKPWMLCNKVSRYIQLYVDVDMYMVCNKIYMFFFDSSWSGACMVACWWRYDASSMSIGAGLSVVIPSYMDRVWSISYIHRVRSIRYMHQVWSIRLYLLIWNADLHRWSRAI